MAYVDKEYYENIFGGESIDEPEFNMLARAASDLCNAIVTVPIKTVTDNIKRAVCYQIELLHRQGWIDAISGLALSAPGVTEKVGDVSYSNAPHSAGTARIYSFGGLPVSPIAYALLRAEGLTSRVVIGGDEPV